jgi:hypothetical protein
MPPWAQLVAVSSMLDFVTMHTLPCFATLIAKVRPAMPDPITRKSTFFLIFNIYPELFINFSSVVLCEYTLWDSVKLSYTEVHGGNTE